MANFTYENFKNAIDLFAPCMHDYLYVFDIENDRYYITEQAVDRFNLDSNTFSNVVESHKQFVHPDDIDMLMADLGQMQVGAKDNHNLKYRWLGKQCQPIWINCKGQLIRDEDGNPQYMIGCINEIGKKQMADNITGLLNTEVLRQEQRKFSERENDKGFLLRLSIDGFRAISQRKGETYAEMTLAKVAKCVQESLSIYQRAFHIIADEIMILDIAETDVEKISLLYEDIRSKLDELIQHDNYDAMYTISGGIVALDLCASCDYDEVMKRTEFALREAKENGHNQVYVFKTDDYEEFLKKRALLVELRRSVANNFRGFKVYFQPIVKSSDENLKAAESLLRYVTEEGNMIPPMEFVPLLESSGLIIPVGRWVLDQALQMCKECRRIEPEFKVTVNLSYIQLLKSPMYSEIMDALKQADLPPNALIVELTESGQLENSPVIQNVWRKLKNAGVYIAIDDFGTGYSNLINIGNLKPNIVKIDRSFSVKALQYEYEYNLLVHIINMVHSLNLELVVEGIETKDELSRINKLKPDFIQGYYYGRPCPENDFLTNM